MSLYEQVIIAKQDLTPAKLNELIEKFTSVVIEDGGKVLKKEDWGLRTFAYKIQKNRKGYYVLLHLEASGKAIIEMERLMRLNENILRYLTIKQKVLGTTPAYILDGSKYKKSKDEELFEGEA